MQKASANDSHYTEIGIHELCQEANLHYSTVDCIVVHVVYLPLPAPFCRPTLLHVCCFWLAIV
jgi:hypothetical protein